MKRGMDVRDTKFVYFQTCLVAPAPSTYAEAEASGEQSEERGETALREVERRELVYDYKSCNGCGICVDICPTNALELGPVTEIAAGLDAPPVIMDVDKCPFCGMCAAFCPYNAFEMFICTKNVDKVGGADNDNARAGRDEHEEWKNFMEVEGYPHLNPTINVDEEKCLPCMLCERVCPMDALEVEWSLPKKEEIAPFDDTRSGEIEVDMEKCSLCGVCTKFCDAFMIVEREFSVEEPVPFADLIVDENACDYCGICVILCPENAIKVRVAEISGENMDEVGEEGGCDGKDSIVPLTEDMITRLKCGGRLIVDERKCKKCGWCVFVCPYDAISVEKPFYGDIMLQNIEKCDPSGCSICRDVCPFNAWFVVWEGEREKEEEREREGEVEGEVERGEEEKKEGDQENGEKRRDGMRGRVDVETSVCIFCGACEKACPENVIVVIRKNARTTPVPETPPWRKQWSEAISKLINPESSDRYSLS